MIAHHPNRDMLLAYAAGHVPEAIWLVIATHLALCPKCHDVVRLGESIGGAMLERLPPEPVSEAMLEQLNRRLTDAEPKASIELSESADARKTPELLYSYIGGDLDEARWIPIAPGLAYRPLISGRCSAQLLRSKPGHGISRHTHEGEEFSLVLGGGYSDSSGHYLRGDFQAANRALVHRPIADDGESCTILMVANGPLIFSNPIISFIAKLIGG